MPVRSLGRTAAALAVTAVAAATLATAAVVPAAAAPPAPGTSATEPKDHTKPAAMPTPEPVTTKPPGDTAPGTDAAVPARYRGKVTAKTGLLLRDKPTRSSRVVGELEYGDIVRIFCRVEGGSVDGNNRWYLLADGSWAWASAKYIRSLGETPHWC
ncbi:SH3 domain-containing protein [Streptomyces sp. NPDC056244]|uniref:SH3 domain-containing protein n=1 Tax=unclassified Streptomyces TaxID=2593676 RepID=UPI0035E2EDA6